MANPINAASSTTAPAFTLGYRPWLDGLRGIAILLVLAFHLGWLPGGSIGVDIFFVLSGFLITTLLLEEWERRGSINLGQFYLRRALRLMPAFATLLLICWLAGELIEPQVAAARRREVLLAACYVSNWVALHNTPMPTLGHTWSLAVEEQFYVLWPLLLLAMLRLRLGRRTNLLIVCAGILSSATLRAALYETHRDLPYHLKSANIHRMYMGLDTRADSLLAGCLVGLLSVWKLLPASRRFLRGMGFVCILATAVIGLLAWKRCFDHMQFYRGLFTVVALLVGAVLVRLLGAQSRPAATILEWRPLVGVGKISYGLYLFHIPVIYWLGEMDRGPKLGATLLVLGITLAAALSSYYLVERPFLRLRNRFSAANSVGPIVPKSPERPRRVAA